MFSEIILKRMNTSIEIYCKITKQTKSISTQRLYLEGPVVVQTLFISYTVKINVIGDILCGFVH